MVVIDCLVICLWPFFASIQLSSRSSLTSDSERLAKEINLRITPEVQFIMDQSIAYGVNMSHKIDEVMGSQDMARDAEADEE